MISTSRLDFVYRGWDGYQQSLVSAIVALSKEQLEFRGAPGMRSPGELAWHIADGRVIWFSRLGVPQSDRLMQQMENRDRTPIVATAIASWLTTTWSMIEQALALWTTEDLTETFSHPYQGQVYAVSRQWTVWRILTHDIHHGGQLSALLSLQGIEPLELTLLGGHLTVPDILT